MSHPTRIMLTNRIMDLFRKLEFNPMLTKKEQEEYKQELDKLLKQRYTLDITLDGKK